MNKPLHVIVTGILGLFLLGGCRKPDFPLRQMHSPITQSSQLNQTIPFDSNHDKKADFFLFVEPSLKGPAVQRIGYDTTGDGTPDEIIRLADIPADQTRHLVLILDGFSHDVIREFRKSYHLGVFYPPSKVVAPYPGLTDLALDDALAAGVSNGFEALYFDRYANRLVGGSMAYLNGENMPYNAKLNHRAGLFTDAIGYVAPKDAFTSELAGAAEKFHKSDTKEFIAYFVSSAGMGTKFGRTGQIETLELIDRFVWDTLWRTRGRTRITLLADHGHSYTPGKRIPLEKHLEGKGWRIRDSLDKPQDVVYIRFGLETYASFCTKTPAKLAADLIAADGVELASYVEFDHVVVLGQNGQKARIHSDGTTYRYLPETGDPLKLTGLLPAGETAAVDAQTELEKTADHEYPAPLQRLWRAHMGHIAKHTPDVIISLANEYYSGSKSFSDTVEVASTHGSANRTNSVTFIMSTVGALPGVLRSADIPGSMKTLLNEPTWPTGK